MSTASAPDKQARAAKENRRTGSGIPLKPYFTRADVRSEDEAPGDFPYTRGLYPDMYRTRLWTMRQYAGLASGHETNARFKRLLEHGQTGLSVAFDLPTQIGLDPDHPHAQADVGIVGVNCATVADMRTMFDGIPLDSVSTSMTINATAGILLGMYLVTADDQGVAWNKVSGTLQNDVLKEFVARGTYNMPVAPAMRLAVDVMEFCANEVPRMNAISVSGYHMREAGCGAVDEVAFALANARAYIDRCLARGMSIDDFAPRISWIFNTHNDFLEEVAKYRALRRMWATMLRDEYGAKNPKSMMLRTHTQTGGSTLTAQQPENNIARAAIQAMAAAFGGVQSMALSCYDEALAIPTERAQQIALRTQQIVAHETGIANVADPLGGSYHVEFLTDEIERKASAELDKIVSLGGAEAAVEKEYYHERIASAAYRFEQELASGERIIVGVNRFTEDVDPPNPPLFRPPQDAWIAATDRVQQVKRARQKPKVETSLALLAKSAKGDDNLMPAIIECVRSYCTIGEITGTLEKTFGKARASTLV